jgi:D-ribose pyranase
MKKSRILNKYLNEAIADMGHTDIIIIADSGFPIPSDAKRVDLAIERDKPGILEILELVMSDLVYEKCIVAEEQKQYNPPLFKKISALCDRCAVETMPHSDIMATMPEKAKYIVRTGAFEPWGNVILYSGVDAPEWFKKPGVSTPDFYASRAEYKEKS